MEKNYSRKRYGQNFLQDKNILEKISNIVDIRNKNIIEIGPGKGALTSLLIKKAKKLIAFEIDLNLVNYLNESIIAKNFKLINQDFLKADLSSYKDYYIIANIPYNISTDILFKIFEYHKNFKYVILLVQKEFAQRIVAQPNSKEYSKLSISTSLFFDSKLCFDVPPTAFWPQPKVTSSVIFLERTKNNYDIVDKWEFLNFIKNCFSMRRKTLWNNLKANYSEIEYKNLIQELGLIPSIRPENIDLETYILLFKNLNKKN